MTGTVRKTDHNVVFNSDNFNLLAIFPYENIDHAVVGVTLQGFLFLYWSEFIGKKIKLAHSYSNEMRKY